MKEILAKTVSGMRSIRREHTVSKESAQFEGNKFFSILGHIKTRLLVIIFVLAALIASPFTNKPVSAATSTNIVGYISGYSLAGGTSLSSIKLEQMTHLIYSYVRVRSASDPTIIDPYWSFTYMKQCVTAAHAKGIKVIVSLFDGGYGLGTIVNSSTLRAQFCTNMANFLTTYNIDGVDIDWEGGGYTRSQVDLLITDLYARLHPLGKLITEAPGADSQARSTSASPSVVANYVDFVLLQSYIAYDLNTLVSWYMNAWVSEGYPKAKLLPGIIFAGRDSSDWIVSYGRIVDILNPPPSQIQTNISSIDGHTVSGGVLHWHSIDSVKAKANYVKTNGFGGMMIYSIAGDKLNDSRSLLQNMYDTFNPTPTANRAPVLNAIGNKSVNEGQSLSFTVSGSDPDGNALTYSASGLPSGATFNTSTKVFSWTPAAGQVGTYSNIRFQVSDGSLTDYENITITVTANTANRAPVLSAIGSKSVNEGASLTFSVSAADPDANPLTYSASNLPSGASFNASTRTFSWTPSYSQAGAYSVRFQVSDGSLTDYEDVTVTVNNVNRAPVLSSIGGKSVVAGNALTFTVSATDPDGNTLAYSASNLPSGATFNASTKVFSWTPASSQAGSYPGIRFQVSDGSLTDYEDIAITVTANTVNRAPVLAAIGSKSVNEGASLTFTVSATDPDGNALTYSASSLPSGATFNPATKVFSWTPTFKQAGTYSVRFQVSDGSLTDSESITITVINANRGKGRK